MRNGESLYKEVKTSCRKDPYYKKESRESCISKKVLGTGEGAGPFEDDFLDELRINP